jgi:hypothetical protein
VNLPLETDKDSLAEEWEDFERRIRTAKSTPLFLAILKDAFYAGALSMGALIVEKGQTYDGIEALMKELVDHANESDARVEHERNRASAASKQRYN